MKVEIGDTHLLSRQSWNRIREIVKRRDNSICYICDEFAPSGEVDHIIPLSQGGSDIIYNLAWSHQKCNREKGGMSFREWNESLNDRRRKETKQTLKDFTGSFFDSSVVQDILSAGASACNRDVIKLFTHEYAQALNSIRMMGIKRLMLEYDDSILLFFEKPMWDLMYKIIYVTMCQIVFETACDSERFTTQLVHTFLQECGDPIDLTLRELSQSFGDWLQKGDYMHGDRMLPLITDKNIDTYQENSNGHHSTNGENGTHAQSDFLEDLT